MAISGAIMGAIASSYKSLYTAEALAFFTAASITDVTQKNAVNQLVVDLKVAGLWTLYTAIYPFVGGTAVAHAQNLKNPGTYTITFTGSPAHSATGTDWNGTTQYADTGVPQNIGSDSSYYIAGYSRENTNQFSCIWGANGTDGKFFPNDSTNFYSDVPGSGNRLTGTPNLDTRGLFSVSITASLLHTFYRNASSVGSRTNTSATYSSGSVTLNHSSTFYQSTRELAYFSMAGTGFSAANVTAEYTAVQAMQTTLSRQV